MTDTLAEIEARTNINKPDCGRCDGKGRFNVDHPTRIWCPSCQGTLTQAKEDINALLKICRVLVASMKYERYCEDCTDTDQLCIHCEKTVEGLHFGMAHEFRACDSVPCVKRREALALLNLEVKRHNI